MAVVDDRFWNCQLFCSLTLSFTSGNNSRLAPERLNVNLVVGFLETGFLGAGGGEAQNEQVFA